MIMVGEKRMCLPQYDHSCTTVQNKLTRSWVWLYYITSLPDHEYGCTTELAYQIMSMVVLQNKLTRSWVWLYYRTSLPDHEYGCSTEQAYQIMSMVVLQNELTRSWVWLYYRTSLPDHENSCTMKQNKINRSLTWLERACKITSQRSLIKGEGVEN